MVNVEKYRQHFAKRAEYVLKEGTQKKKVLENLEVYGTWQKPVRETFWLLISLLMRAFAIHLLRREKNLDVIWMLRHLLPSDPAESWIARHVEASEDELQLLKNCRAKVKADIRKVVALDEPNGQSGVTSEQRRQTFFEMYGDPFSAKDIKLDKQIEVYVEKVERFDRKLQRMPVPLD